MSDGFSIGDRYRAAAESFIELARSLTDDEWATPVPCCPGWTARDVLSHVSGIPDDAMHGRLDGVATEPWTASQVERNAHFAVGELLDRWLAQYSTFADAIEAMDQERPPIDCFTHEHDVRHAIGRPGARDGTVFLDVVAHIMDGLVEAPVDVTVETTDMGVFAPGGSGPAVSASGVSGFEVFRSRLGRRSRAQVEAWHWAGGEDAVRTAIDHWFVFGPTESEIVE